MWIASEHVVRAAAAEEADHVRRQGEAGPALGVALRDQRIVALVGGRGAEEQQLRPARLDGVALVEARDQRVPRDVRRDHVDPSVDRGGGELDAAAVGAAGHADARVARLVEQRLGPMREPRDQRGHVACLELSAVDLRKAARGTEAPRIPRQHVVAGATERTDTDEPERGAGGRVRIRDRRAAPARAFQHRRRALPAAQPDGGEEVQVDLGAVE